MTDQQESRVIGMQRSDIDEDEISLDDLLDVVIGARWLIGVIAAAFLFFGIAYALIATPIYQADSLLQVEAEKSGLGALEITELLEGDASTTAEIELLRSRMVLGTAVDNLRLDIQATPHYFPIIGEAIARRHDGNGAAGAWFGMDSYAWGGELLTIDTLEVPLAYLGEPLILVAGQGGAYTLENEDGDTLLRGKVGESVVSGTGNAVFSMFVPELIANEGTNFTITRSTRLKVIEDLQKNLSVSEKGKNSGVLSIALTGPDPQDVRKVVNEIANIYVRKNVERKSAEAEKTLEFLDEQLPDIKQRMEAAEVALNNYRLEMGSIDLPLETQALLEQVVTAEEELLQLEQERDGLIQRFTVEHPMIVALDDQIQRVRRIVEGLNTSIQKLPDTQQEVLRLHRDVQVSTELYTALLHNAQELRVVKAGTVGNVRVVDYAETPYKPIKPKKSMIVLLSLMLGLFAGLVAAFVRKALTGGVEDPDLIEQAVGIPVYAVVTHSGKQDKLEREIKAGATSHKVLAEWDQNDVAIEAIRNLRTALHFGMLDVINNIIMITGPAPGIGKSFVSVNLAAILASADKKVLLIDGDLRLGHLHESFGFNKENGVTEFVSGAVKIGDIIKRTTVQNVDLITTGKKPPNPAELLLHTRFVNLLKVLSKQYDHVIIDSAPILAVTDAGIIGQMAGATLMVLKAGEHPMREIELAVKRMRQSKVNLRGLVVNDLRVTSRKYGAGKYNYQYAYDNK